jgi:hypothetical protein
MMSRNLTVALFIPTMDFVTSEPMFSMRMTGIGLKGGDMQARLKMEWA